MFILLFITPQFYVHTAHLACPYPSVYSIVYIWLTLYFIQHISLHYCGFCTFIQILMHILLFWYLYLCNESLFCCYLLFKQLNVFSCCKLVILHTFSGFQPTWRVEYWCNIRKVYIADVIWEILPQGLHSWDIHKGGPHYKNTKSYLFLTREQYIINVENIKVNGHTQLPLK